jgi:hypothetical protein
MVREMKTVGTRMVPHNSLSLPHKFSDGDKNGERYQGGEIDSKTMKAGRDKGPRRPSCGRR